MKKLLIGIVIVLVGLPAIAIFVENVVIPCVRKQKYDQQYLRIMRIRQNVETFKTFGGTILDQGLENWKKDFTLKDVKQLRSLSIPIDSLMQQTEQLAEDLASSSIGDEMQDATIRKIFELEIRPAIYKMRADKKEYLEEIKSEAAAEDSFLNSK